MAMSGQVMQHSRQPMQRICYLLRARVNAELTPLAAVGADDDLRHRRSFLS
jgi:hypothetical protein